MLHVNLVKISVFFFPSVTQTDSGGCSYVWMMRTENYQLEKTGTVISFKTFSLFSSLYFSKSLLSICLMQYEEDTSPSNFNLRHVTLSFTTIKYSPAPISLFIVDLAIPLAHV